MQWNISILRRTSFTLSLLAFSLMFVAPASAHEVYVLPADVVAQAMQQPAFSGWDTALSHIEEFILWATVALATVVAVFFASISRRLEDALDPFLRKLPSYAPAISRITIGLALLAGSYYGAMFGPELPLTVMFGEYSGVIRIVLAVLGLMLVFGWYARIAALGALVLFGIETLERGSYMLTYSNYFGEILVLFILGAHMWGMHGKKHERKLPWLMIRMKETFAPYSLTILRVCFGVSLLFSSLYAKVIHNNLALAVATLPLGHARTLWEIFGFEPHFFVLGAAIVEIVIAIFFILGIEIRFTSLFLEFWLMLSLWYFGEAVWPHLILIGIPIAFIFYGYDKYSLEGFLFKKQKRMPVL